MKSDKDVFNGKCSEFKAFKVKIIYHITWTPKYRKKKSYEELRKYLGEVAKPPYTVFTKNPNRLFGQVTFYFDVAVDIHTSDLAKSRK